MGFQIIDRQWYQVFERAAAPARQRALIITPFLRKATLEALLGDRPSEVKVITRFNARLEAAFSKFGRLTEGDLAGLDWP